MLPLFAVGAEKMANTLLFLSGQWIPVVTTLGGVQVPVLGGCAWFAIVMRHMMIVVAPAV